MSFSASGDVLVAHLAGEAVLLNLADKSYYRLNETAAAIWKLIESGSSRGQIIGSLVSTYDIDEVAATREVDELVRDLEERRLLTGGND